MTSGNAATLTFDANFSSLSLWNGTSGTWATNYWYNALNGNGGSLPTNGELEWYINSNDPQTSSVTPWTVNNGILTLTAAPAPASIQPLINNYQYTSGELNTYHSFSQTYGYFEMRAELPAGQGLWPAFWMLPENGSWPPELDIMEELGQSPTTLYTTVHSEANGQEVNNGVGSTVANSSTAYHTYAVNWTPTTITWYFDGQQVFQAATPADMNTPMYLELDLAVGGGWPGSPNASTKFPANMNVAWVHAYSSNPNPNPTTNTYTANGTAGQLLVGDAGGTDIFNAGTSSVIMTGGADANTFVFNALPKSAGQITDFDPATDTINVAGLLQSVGYKGANPFGDGTLSLVSDGHNGTDVVYKATSTSPAQTIVDLDNVAASAINTSTDFIVSGSGAGSGGPGNPPPPGGSGTPGPTLSANNTAGQILTATAPNATFNAGQSSAVMTEDGGANAFVYTALPYNAGEITNFNPATDKINVSAMLTAAGYHGANPFGDGTLSLTSDGHGGTDLTYNPPGAGANGIWPITVVDLHNVAASSINVAMDFVTSTGMGIGTGTPGITLTANNTAGQALTGTPGNDTFNAGQNSVIMTGDGGSDTFVYAALPYNAGQIKDFNPSLDKIDVSAMLTAAGYHGLNPFGDGTLGLTSDGHGGTDLMYNPPGAGSNGIWSVTVVDLDNVQASAINVANDFITSGTGASGTGTSGGSSSSGGTTSNTTGITLTANDTAGQVLMGTPGNDTFYAGHNSVVMTGDGGSDSFVFNYQPWNAGQITDFNPATDTINVHGLLSAAGYTGASPFTDGMLSLGSDGNGGTNLYYHQTSTSIPIKIVDLDHVAPSSIHVATDFIFH